MLRAIIDRSDIVSAAEGPVAIYLLLTAASDEEYNASARSKMRFEKLGDPRSVSAATGKPIHCRPPVAR